MKHSGHNADEQTVEYVSRKRNRKIVEQARQHLIVHRCWTHHEESRREHKQFVQWLQRRQYRVDHRKDRKQSENQQQQCVYDITADTSCISFILVSAGGLKLYLFWFFCRYFHLPYLPAILISLPRSCLVSAININSTTLMAAAYPISYRAVPTSVSSVTIVSAE